MNPGNKFASPRNDISGRGEAPSVVKVGVRGMTALILVWVVLGLYVVHASLPVNALVLPGQATIEPTLHAVAPEGWAFFTKSARSDELVTFKKTSAGWRSNMLGTYAEPSNYFGLDRRPRSQGVEIAMLVNGQPRSAWTSCGPVIADCLELNTGTIKVTNISPDPTFCGLVRTVDEVPVPWAWRRLLKSNSIHSGVRVLQMNVTC